MKKFITQIVLCFLLLSATVSYGAEPKAIGIIGALDEEVAAITELMEQPQKQVVDYKIFWTGTIHHHPVVLVQSGVGKVNAAATTQLLIHQFGVHEIIFTGVAGGINPKNRIGDVVIATQLLQHDYGIVSPDGKKLWQPGTIFNEKDLWFQLDQSAFYKKLASSVNHVKLEPGHRPTVKPGVIVSGDEFIASEDKRAMLERTFKADAVEMEGGAFAQVCKNNQVDCVVIRTISDLANENSKIDFPKFAAYAARNSARLVNALLKNL